MLEHFFKKKQNKTKQSIFFVQLFSRPGGCAGLVEPHGFTQPACKVDFFHFRAFNKRVALWRNTKKNAISVALKRKLTHIQV